MPKDGENIKIEGKCDVLRHRRVDDYISLTIFSHDRRPFFREFIGTHKASGGHEMAASLRNILYSTLSHKHGKAMAEFAAYTQIHNIDTFDLRLRLKKIKGSQNQV